VNSVERMIRTAPLARLRVLSLGPENISRVRTRPVVLRAFLTWINSGFGPSAKLV